MSPQTAGVEGKFRSFRMTLGFLVLGLVRLRHTYGSVYGMEKTTVYLPKPLKVALQRQAAATGVTEASLIRDAIARATDAAASPRPTLPLFRSEVPDLAERADEALAGLDGIAAFGDR